MPNIDVTDIPAGDVDQSILSVDQSVTGQHSMPNIDVTDILAGDVDQAIVSVDQKHPHKFMEWMTEMDTSKQELSHETRY